MAVLGMILNDKVDEAINRQAQSIAHAIESLVILSPETALDIISQLSEQVNEEFVNKTLKERNEFFQKLLAKM